jgi:16S rRNA C967 or C1407 C5-methylase (RsmB/RsmF family)
LTYSTCTINALENERMVSYMLKEFPALELLPIETPMGKRGLGGHGLDDEHRDNVRRFDPHDELADTMGFFVALFQKKEKKRKTPDN